MESSHCKGYVLCLHNLLINNLVFKMCFLLLRVQFMVTNIFLEASEMQEKSGTHQRAKDPPHTQTCDVQCFSFYHCSLALLSQNFNIKQEMFQKQVSPHVTILKRANFSLRMSVVIIKRIYGLSTSEGQPVSLLSRHLHITSHLSHEIKQGPSIL